MFVIGMCPCKPAPQHGVRSTRKTGSLGEVIRFVAWAVEGKDRTGPKRDESRTICLWQAVEWRSRVEAGVLFGVKYLGLNFHPPLKSCLTLSSSLHHYVLSFLICKMGRILRLH